MRDVSLRQVGRPVMQVVLQVNDDLCVDVSLYAGIAVSHNIFPYAAIATLGHQCFPPRAAKSVFSLLGTELHYRVQKGQVKAPHLDPGAPRSRCHGSEGGQVAIM